jgi:hypothetical protein
MAALVRASDKRQLFDLLMSVPGRRRVTCVYIDRQSPRTWGTEPARDCKPRRLSLR